MLSRIAIVILTIGIFWTAAPADAQEPPWSGQIIARGENRVEINSTHILNRPYRPFHFYGNTVRRQHYRSRTIPTGADVVRGLAALVTRR